MTLCGLVAGYAIAAAAVRYPSGFLFGVTTYDFTNFVTSVCCCRRWRSLPAHYPPDAPRASIRFGD